MDFPTWFNAGCYGGLACCMFAIAANALYTTLHKRGTTRQLSGAIVTCVISALLLLPAIVWYNLRFSSQQGIISLAEIEVVLVYIALCGWVLPLGVTVAYCLYTLPRDSATAGRIPSSRVVGPLNPPRYQPGVPAPYIFGEDIPWGWLEYRSGSFQGQRLALKRAVATIGRDENSDIWIDDDMASRYHAELAYDRKRVYLTDRNSLNGTMLNKQHVHGTTLLTSNDIIEIGTHCFSFILARVKPYEDNDPLAHRTSFDTVKESSHIDTDKEVLIQENLPITSQQDALHTSTEAQAIPKDTSADLPNSSWPRSGPTLLRLPSKQKDQ